MNRARRLARYGPALAALMLIIVGAPAVVVSRLEERDAFCIACHTVPEVTYFDRAGQAVAGSEAPLDLSSAHYRLVAEGFRCIDCHRGDEGVVHRATTLALGARDALIFVAGRADPSIEKAAFKPVEVPVLLTASCVKCHAEALLVTGFENHFHNKLPEAFRAWRAGGRLASPPDAPGPTELMPSETSVLCVDCHRAHVHVPGAELQAYLDVEGAVYPACIACHRDEGRGPLELQAPG